MIPWEETLVKPILVLLLVFLFPLPSVAAQKSCIESINGDDRNPGIFSAAPTKSRTYEDLIQAKASEKQTTYRTQREIVPYSSSLSPQLERIILGTEIVTEWKAFTQSIWQTPLDLDSMWYLEDMKVGGEYFYPGCFADFIDDGQCYWQPETGILYINDADGSPQDTGKDISLFLYDYQTDEGKTLTLKNTDWTPAPPSVWQSELGIDPIHVFVNGDIPPSSDCWWGPLCWAEPAGKEDTLYFRDSEGSPDDTGKEVEAVTQSGGWGVASGDFNGDGLTDMVHSSCRNEMDYQIFVNYGESEFSTTPKQILTRPDDQIRFGFFVASAGDVNNDGYDELLVANGWGDNFVFIYMGSAAGLSPVPSLRILPPDGVSPYGFGHGIAGNGSINGDEYADILIMGGDESESYLCVYLGGKGGLRSTPDAVLQFADNMTGGNVSIPGDLNRDGFDEVVLSMGGHPPVSRVEILVFNGTADGRLSNPRHLEIASPTVEVSIKAEVASAGDINNDGYDDLLVGNQYGRGDYDMEGKAYVFLGSADGVSTKPSFTLDNPLPEFNARFGQSLSGIGDWNHDGFDDVAVGCPYHQNSIGFAAIYAGGAKGIAATPLIVIQGVERDSYFGWSMAKGGDLKGNGDIFFIAGEEFGGAYLYGHSQSVPGCGIFSPGRGESAGRDLSVQN